MALNILTIVLIIIGIIFSIICIVDWIKSLKNSKK